MRRAGARITGQRLDAEALLDIAKDVEAQVIKVPTGLQDYRPAMYGGIAALELRRRPARARAARRRSAASSSAASCSATPASRATPGTNNWDITKRHIDGDPHVFDCFERIRDTAAAMREALTRGDWDATAACLATEWDNRKRLAPGVTTPAIDALIARAMAAGAKAAKVCGAGGGGCLFCLVAAGRRAGGPRSAGRRRRARCSTSASRPTGLHVDAQ